MFYAENDATCVHVLLQHIDFLHICIWLIAGQRWFSLYLQICNADASPVTSIQSCKEVHKLTLLPSSRGLLILNEIHGPSCMWLQEEYAREGIDWSYVEFVDNQDCLDLLEGNSSAPGLAVFPLIDFR